MSKKDNKKAIVAVAILLVLVLGAILAWFLLRPKPAEVPDGTVAVTAEVPNETVDAAAEVPDGTVDAAAEVPDGTVDAAAEVPDGTIGVDVAVTHKDGSIKEFNIRTDAENLRGALEQENLIQGDESQYGLYVKTVDGETADDGAQEWWCFTKDGEMLMTGVDDTVIADGEHYEIVFTVGW